MSFTIAITGKGGVGKTTVAALLVMRLAASGRRPILAVDADPNSCLDTALGVKVVSTVGGVREDAKILAGEGKSTGVAKHELLRLKISQSLVETQDFDLIAMGRSEGPGCYCYANNALRATLKEISDDYPYVVIDNEAGLENLSRRIVREVDLMIMVADPSRQGLDTLRRLHGLSQEMHIQIKRLVLVINRMRRNALPDAAAGLREETGAIQVIGLPDDEALARLAESGGLLREIPPENPVVAGIDRLLSEIHSSAAVVPSRPGGIVNPLL
jgi:CO dehydrogenase maturation factor